MKCAPMPLRENPCFDTKARLARMCLCAGRVVRFSKLCTLLASFLHCPALLLLHLPCFYGADVTECAQYPTCVGVLSN